MLDSAAHTQTSRDSRAAPGCPSMEPQKGTALLHTRAASPTGLCSGQFEMFFRLMSQDVSAFRGSIALQEFWNRNLRPWESLRAYLENHVKPLETSLRVNMFQCNSISLQNVLWPLSDHALGRAEKVSRKMRDSAAN